MTYNNYYYCAYLPNGKYFHHSFHIFNWNSTTNKSCLFSLFIQSFTYSIIYTCIDSWTGIDLFYSAGYNLIT